MKLKSILQALLIVGVVGGTAACSSMQSAEKAPQSQEATQQLVSLYEVRHEDGRLYYFDDYSAYQHFLEHDETPYTYKRIAAGAKGETLVFGLTSKDKKKTSGIASVDMIDGKLVPEMFYGELRHEGRIYVFNRIEDMNEVRATGEAALRFTDIGSGPKGETVVYVLNKHNKKKRPDALIAQFKGVNAIQ
ncbi:hypothetical protein SAMN02745127_00068 [Oceanospirillum multiglobuliferum]|uniref:Lipoprotein n=2 Tax=Oceanospirillum TaxID=965 RepID=A0A1T4KG98_9GAMM|nr:hypothetical protein [Oceanospirillum multiglobuliferum]OPX56023.1 hypothetical protein BTE48_05540 [Oceanospirillum multiglobuliferum]SJZ41405.1 hypothetical protein SAMN02745127_00068 [Oceanospirillum multiglobuliferum]